MAFLGHCKSQNNVGIGRYSTLTNSFSCINFCDAFRVRKYFRKKYSVYCIPCYVIHKFLPVPSPLLHKLNCPVRLADLIIPLVSSF